MRSSSFLAEYLNANTVARNKPPGKCFFHLPKRPQNGVAADEFQLAAARNLRKLAMLLPAAPSMPPGWDYTLTPPGRPASLPRLFQKPTCSTESTHPCRSDIRSRTSVQGQGRLSPPVDDAAGLPSASEMPCAPSLCLVPQTDVRRSIAALREIGRGSPGTARYT
jgi:hypothetical protein